MINLTSHGRGPVWRFAVGLVFAVAWAIAALRLDLQSTTQTRKS